MKEILEIIKPIFDDKINSIKVNPFKLVHKSISVEDGLTLKELTIEFEKVQKKFGIKEEDLCLCSEECNTLGSSAGLSLIFGTKEKRTKKEMNEVLKTTFNKTIYSLVYKKMIKEGYKRVGFSSLLLKEFDDTTVYDMYTKKEFQRLEKYYSLYFIPNEI